MARGVVVFHITKNRERRAVPWPDRATGLREWSKVRGLDCDLVFPGSNPDRPLYIEKVWREALDTPASRISAFTISDIRPRPISP